MVLWKCSWKSSRAHLTQSSKLDGLSSSTRVLLRIWLNINICCTACAYVYVYVHVCACVHICVFVHVCTYTQCHTCTCRWDGSKVLPISFIEGTCTCTLQAISMLNTKVSCRIAGLSLPGTYFMHYIIAGLNQLTGVCPCCFDILSTNFGSLYNQHKTTMITILSFEN